MSLPILSPARTAACPYNKRLLFKTDWGMFLRLCPLNFEESPEVRFSRPRSISCAGFVYPPHPDQLRDIQQVVQGIGPVPELMLPPETGGYRQKEELVDVRAGQGDVGAGGFPSGPDCSSPKKPDRLQAMPSSSSFMQDGVSYSSSG